MSATLLDGKALAKKIQTELQNRIQTLQARCGRPPGLAVLMVGDNPASAVYVRNKEKACTRVGIASFGNHFPAETSQSELETAIARLNEDPSVDGILVQLPLPKHIDAVEVLCRIHPDKDADGLHPTNLGRLVRGEPGLRSCTPAGIMQLLRAYDLPLAGQQAVVVGRSILVGKPIALMLLEANATVAIAHSRTSGDRLAQMTQEADILVVAAGKPQLVTADMVKPGAIVVDVGINRLVDAEGNARLVGDVDGQAIAAVAGYLTPVPGGVGPMTVASLLQNTVTSYSNPR